jgi:hypothetical protein
MSLKCRINLLAQEICCTLHVPVLRINLNHTLLASQLLRQALQYRAHTRCPAAGVRPQHTPSSFAQMTRRSPLGKPGIDALVCLFLVSPNNAPATSCFLTSADNSGMLLWITAAPWLIFVNRGTFRCFLTYLYPLKTRSDLGHFLCALLNSLTPAWIDSSAVPFAFPLSAMPALYCFGFTP